MSGADCLPGYNWYVCTSPGWEYKGCCSIDACRSGCGSEYRQENARTPIDGPTMTATTAGRKTVTSTIRLPLKSSSTLSSTEDASFTILATLSTFSTSTISVSTLETLTSISASTVSETSLAAAETTAPASGAKSLNTRAIVGGAVGGFLGCIAFSLIGYWIFRRLGKGRTTKNLSQASTKSSAPRSFSSVPETTRVPEAAAATASHSAPPAPLQTSLPSPSAFPSQPVELSGLPTTPTTPQAPLELPPEQDPAPRVSIYDPSTLSMTIHREAGTHIPRRALAPLVGNPQLRRAARRRSDFGATNPLPAMPRTADNLNTRGFRSSAPPGTFPVGSGGTGGDGQREVENLSNIRHLSWQDWEEQGFYLTRGPGVMAPAAGGRGRGAGGVRGELGGIGVGDEGDGGNHGGQGYREEGQPEDRQGATRRAAPRPGDRHSY